MYGKEHLCPKYDPLKVGNGVQMCSKLSDIEATTESAKTTREEMKAISMGTACIVSILSVN